jgi:lathosterol oxidase
MAPNWKNVALSATSGALALVAVAPALLPLLGDVDWSPRWMDSSNASLSKSGEYNPYRDFNRWVNNIILPTSVTSYFANNYSEEAAYYITSYVRDFIMGTIVYWVTAGLWHYTIYDLFGEELFTKKGRSFPTTETFLDTIRLAQSSVVLYAALPVMSEYLIENRWTKAYFYIDEVGGWSQYLAYLIIYIMLVEIGIYWVHRTLHTNKFLYKYFHALHHKYNKPSTLSPWVSIAFNPIDGLMQVRET